MAAQDMNEEAMKTLSGELQKCTSCQFRENAYAPVGWFGALDSPIVFIGEGPGEVEDNYGCPLIGPSGQLFDKALWAAQMTRDRVLSTNVIKCYPKGNRTPVLAEAELCAQKWLDRELEILKPKVIVALGGVAMHYLGDPKMKITHDRGKWFKTKYGIDCIATFHPAYLLRLKNNKALHDAKWNMFYDLQSAREKAYQTCPDYVFMSEEKVNLFKIFKRINKS